MNILVTGSSGFVGRNLCENLKCLRDGRNRTRPSLSVGEIYECDRGSTPEELDSWCASADIVINLAGVNRPRDPADLKENNLGFEERLLGLLKKHDNRCPVILSSSVQAALAGRFGRTEYGLIKRECEEMMFRYSAETGARVYVYRFPNLAGKWVRPNYNSAVGTFCHNIANDLPINVDDPSVVLELLFIDDLLEELYDAIEGHPHRCDYPPAGEDGCDGLTPKPSENGRYCYAPVTYKASLGHIVECLHAFHDQPQTLMMPAAAPDSFEKKLFSMYISYLPADRAAFPLKTSADERGSFTELIKTFGNGQISVNITKPGAVKGQHWHNSKWEIFVVVAGHGLIRQRRLGTGEVIEYDVRGDDPKAVYMLPGYTHSIENLSDTDDLVTIMWANETFDAGRPDTFSEPV